MILTNSKITVVIPAFNEEKTIGEVVRSLVLYCNEIIVVNDGSSDDTGKKALEAGAIVISHDVNKGYDVSVDDGFKKAAEHKPAIIATFDADGQHQVGDLLKLADLVKSGQADVAIGKRPSFTHVMERIFAFYTSWRFNIPDPLVGLKVYSYKVYEKIGHFATMDLIGSQLCIEAAKAGFKIVSLPISINEREDVSRFYSRRLQGNVKVLRALIRVILFE